MIVLYPMCQTVLFTIPNIWLAFDTVADTCLWNFSWSSIITPTSFDSVTGARCILYFLSLGALRLGIEF